MTFLPEHHCAGWGFGLAKEERSGELSERWAVVESILENSRLPSGEIDYDGSAISSVLDERFGSTHQESSRKEPVAGSLFAAARVSDQSTALLKEKNEIESNLIAGGTGLTGNSDQAYVEVRPIIVDYYEAVVISARLGGFKRCLLYTSPSPRDQRGSRMPSSA